MKFGLAKADYSIFRDDPITVAPASKNAWPLAVGAEDPIRSGNKDYFSLHRMLRILVIIRFLNQRNVAPIAKGWDSPVRTWHVLVTCPPALSAMTWTRSLRTISCKGLPNLEYFNFATQPTNRGCRHSGDKNATLAIRSSENFETPTRNTGILLVFAWCCK